MTYNIWYGSSYGGKLSLESFANEEEMVNEVTGEVVGDVADELPALVEESEQLSAGVDTVQQSVRALDAGEVVAGAGTKIQNRGTPATMEEAALIQAGVAQTLQATNAPDEVVNDAVSDVATESYDNGFQISMEGFVETLKRIWQSIKEFVQRIWQGIKNTFNRMWNSTASVLKRAKKLKDNLDKKKDEYSSSKPEIKLSSGNLKLLSDTKNIKFDYKGLIKEYGSSADGAKADLEVYTDSIKTIRENTIKVVEELAKKVNDDKALETDVKAAYDDVMKNITESFEYKTKVADLEALSTLNTNDMKGYLGKIKTYKFSNFTIAFGYDRGEHTARGKINSFTIKKVSRHNTFNPSGTKELKVDSPYNLSDLKSIPDKVEDCIKGLEDFYNKDSKKMDDDIQKFRKDLDEKTDKVGESWNGLAKEVMSTAQRLYVIPTQILRGAMEVCVYHIKLANAMCAFGEAHLKHLKDEKDKS